MKPRGTRRTGGAVQGGIHLIHPAVQGDGKGANIATSVGAPQSGIDATTAARLQAAGLRGAGVAHDLNNLLGVILGYCDELRGQQSLPETACAMIAEMESAGNAAKLLARSLLLPGGRAPQALAIDVNEGVRRMRSLLIRILGQRVTLAERLGDGAGMTAIEPGQLEQILMNLAANARDAMAEGGSFRVETARVWLDEADTRQRPDLHAGNYVRLTVSDTGIGMDAGTQSQIFEAFFTTKPEGQGTGLGLSTIATIVDNAGGFIQTRSQPGCGTTFDIYLPRTDPRGHSSQRPAETSGAILLVDDSEPLRALTRRILEEAGYSVLDAGRADEALAMMHSPASPISLLITDVKLPVQTGVELAGKFAALCPAIPVLFVSGYCDGRNLSMQTGSAGRAYLEKPFTRGMLLAAVADLLHPAGHSPESGKFAPASVAPEHREGQTEGHTTLALS